MDAPSLYFLYSGAKTGNVDMPTSFMDFRGDPKNFSAVEISLAK
jgi:hypothetical protein